MANTSTKRKPPLPWNRAAAAALVAVAVILSLAIVFNVAIGRMIHWDIVAVLGGLGYLGLTLAIRFSR
ncbi:MAG: hypothetical protein V3S20_07830 [Dehalococcoidia bacterium]